MINVQLDPINEFKKEVSEIIEAQSNNERFKEISEEWIVNSFESKYEYTFRWMGRPIIQYPQDIIAMQEIIWDVKPDLVIETGIAHGGSLIFYSSMMKLLDISLNRKNRGHVVGVDIDIRQHNRKEIEAHPMYEGITMIEGSSIDKAIVDQVRDIAEDYSNVLVVFDSNHTKDHVFNECKMYADLVTIGSYMVVMDTITGMYYERINKEGIALKPHLKRPWTYGNTVADGLREFLQCDNRFVVDSVIDNKLMISSTPGGYLKRII